MKLSEYPFNGHRVMISFPMNGKNENDVKHEYLHHIRMIREAAGDRGVTIVNTMFNNYYHSHVKHPGIRFLGASLKAMSNVDAVYFAPGYENARGCKIEYEVAKQYGVDIITNDE